MQLTVSHQFLPKQNSTRASLVMDHFGIDFAQGEHVIARELEIPFQTGEIVLFTGESGSGKSSLMRAVATKLAEQGRRIVSLDELCWEDRILVDLIPLSLEESLQLLVACGLGEAHLMLRTPAEVSDGQRYRFRLALALAQRPEWVIADEFTATLDRRLARTIAFNLRKIASRSGVGFLLATTHDDVAEDLSADVQVRCRLDGAIDVQRLDGKGDVKCREQNCQMGEDFFAASGSRNVLFSGSKKKCLRSPTISGSPLRPSPTGRTSLGGITAAITSD